MLSSIHRSTQQPDPYRFRTKYLYHTLCTTCPVNFIFLRVLLYPGDVCRTLQIIKGFSVQYLAFSTLPTTAFLKLFPVEELLRKLFVCREPVPMKRKRNHTGAVVGARRLLQSFQLPPKNSRDISSYIYNILRYFKIVMYLFHYYSRNPYDVL